MTVSVVTDSSAHLAPGLAARNGVVVVPLHVLLDGVSHLDGVDIGPEELVTALTSGRPSRRRQPPSVTTSRPSVAELVQAYADAGAAGADVLAVHLSRQLSGTWDAGRLAAHQLATSGPRVRLVDSGSTSMGLGFPVLAAARAAAAGADLDGAHAVAVDVAARCRTLLCVDTLEHLRRGGRIGAAAAALGTALSVKPLLHVVDGRLESLEKVRTSARALVRLVELVARAAGDAPTALAVHHLGAPERAEALVAALRERLPSITELHVSSVGAVVGAHLGPGMVGVVVCPGGAGDPGPGGLSTPT